MRGFALILAVALATQPARADEAETTPPGLTEIAPFMESLRGLMEGWAQEARPLIEQLAEKMSDLNAYEPPEVLPNGDIIIRRKSKPDEAPNAPLDQTPQPNPDGSIDL